MSNPKSKIVRVGIYNRWLHTMGGGERYMGTIAEALAADDRYRVELLTDREVDLAELGRRLNLDVSRLHLRLLPRSHATHNYTAPMQASHDYDLFINASHLDLFPSFARRNVVAVYFPAQLPPLPIAPTGRAAMVSRGLGATARLRLFAGFYGAERSAAGGVITWTQERASILLPPGNHELVVQLVATAPRPDNQPTTVRFSLNGEQLPAVWQVPADNFSIHNLRLPADLLARAGGASLLTLEVDAPFTPGEGDQRVLGIALSQLNLLRANGRDYVARLLRRRYAGSPQLWQQQAAVAMRDLPRSLDAVWSISEFTAEWIRRYWGVDSDILYPPVDVDSFAPGDKVNCIVSVGRFFAGSHNKKHDVQVQAFRELCDEGLTGWEYHLLGNVGDQPEDAAYLATVKRLAEGYPIFVHDNAPFSELQATYAASKLFWHATGFGEDIEASPERFEHFGITTVEAMAAGCVPVVIAAAGQVEIVRPEVDGLLWRDMAELKAMTRRLIADDGLRAKLAASAVERSRQFDKAHVIAHLHELIADLKL